MVDDGKSAKEIYRVDNFDLVEIPEEDYGKFYSGDCYVVLYAYTVNNRDNYIIYYWLVSSLGYWLNVSSEINKKLRDP